uniref:Uncharacterized protein n=1 Tax=Arundo donax TaxID=35708 RepID=A0A0A9EYM1_ARUDO
MWHLLALTKVNWNVEIGTDLVLEASTQGGGLGKDYKRQALPLKCVMQRGCFEPRTS